MQVVEAPAKHTMVKRSDLRTAPWNARKTFDEKSLAELTASVKQHGILTPLLVRPIVFGKGKVEYEIVAGHRRNLVAGRLDLPELPCTVRDMGDDEAREIGLTENLQRADLHPLEEASALAELMQIPGATIESVAAKVGLNPGYVARRLRLLDAADEVKNALRAGAIEVGHALELARLAETQQLKLLARMNVTDQSFDADDDYDEDDADVDDDSDNDDKAPRTNWRPTPMSVAELRRVIGQTTLRILSDAPFELADEIPPVACTECPKRSINSALLFSDIAQDTCTDRECYNGKIRAWIRYSLERAEENKQKLVQLSESYSSEKSVVSRWDVILLSGDKVTPCTSQEEAIWINGEHAGHKVFICRENDCKIHRSNGSSAKSTEQRKKENDAVNAAKRYRKALFTAIANAQLDPKVAGDFIGAICEHTIRRMTSLYNNKLAEALGWDPKILGFQASKDALSKKLAGMTTVDKLRAAVLAAHVGELAVQSYNLKAQPIGFETVARTLGIDTKALKVEAYKKPQKAVAVKPAKPIKTAKSEFVKAAKKPPTKTPTKAVAEKPVANKSKKK